jgi:hypothetical protein
MDTSLVGEIAAKSAALPPAEQREVLEFVEFKLRRQQPAPTSDAQARPKKPPFRSVRGIFADSGVSITEDDIAEVRREMWANFPREEPH